MDMTTSTGPVPPEPRPPTDLAARERVVRRSKAVAAAASFGGFASLVAVLIGHPAQATTSTTTHKSTSTTTNQPATTGTSRSTGSGNRTSSTGSSNSGTAASTSGSTVTPDTTTSAS
jgi:hypothetical protein